MQREPLRVVNAEDSVPIRAGIIRLIVESGATAVVSRRARRPEISR